MRASAAVATETRMHMAMAQTVGSIIEASLNLIFEPSLLLRVARKLFSQPVLSPSAGGPGDEGGKENGSI